MSEELLTTTEAARLMGVGPTAFKRWADEGLLPCVRTAGGHRRFARPDVEQLLRQRGAPAAGPGTSAWLDRLLAPESVYDLEALLLGERAVRGAWYRVAEVAGGVLAELGQAWADGRISVMQEHLASERMRRALARIAEAIPSARQAPRCLLAAAEGDDHTLGLSLVEVCAREAGWTCRFVGRRTPLEDLLDAIGRREIEMVALSASASSTDVRKLKKCLKPVEDACAATGIPLVLGGEGAWPERPHRAHRFRGLEAFHRFAVETLERLNG